MVKALESDLSRSNKLLVGLVWSATTSMLDDGTTMPMERRSDYELASQLDTLVGNDAWQFCFPNGMHGIASPTQVGAECTTITNRLSLDSVQRAQAVMDADPGLVKKVVQP